MIRVYVVRHAKAEKESSTARDDDRELTARGLRQAEHLASAVASHARPPLGLILSSPIRRAIHTAEIMQSRLRCELMICRELVTDAPVSEALELIARHGGTKCSIAMVGHNPQLGELLAVMTAGIGSRACILRTGEAVSLEVRGASPIGSGKILAQIRLDEDVTPLSARWLADRERAGA